MSSNIQQALCHDCGQEPRRLRLTAAAKFCFKLVVFLDALIPANDEVYYQNGLDMAAIDAYFDEMLAPWPEDKVIPE